MIVKFSHLDFMYWICYQTMITCETLVQFDVRTTIQIKLVMLLRTDTEKFVFSGACVEHTVKTNFSVNSCQKLGQIGLERKMNFSVQPLLREYNYILLFMTIDACCTKFYWYFGFRAWKHFQFVKQVVLNSKMSSN